MTASANAGEGLTMAHRHSSKHRDKRLRREERRALRHDGSRKRGAQRKRDPLTPEERAYLQARARANRRVGVAIHSMAYAATLLMFLVTTRSIRVVMIVGSIWGLGLAIHVFVASIIPELRRRWIDEEVGRQVDRGVVSEHRREIEGRHVRSLEDLSAQVAHEIRNPIAAAKSLVQQMGEDPTSGDNIEYAGVALSELDRVERSISHLLRYAREEELRRELIDVADVLDSALDTFRDRLEREEVEVVRDISAAGIMRGDPEKLRRVAINLIGNALDAMEQAETPDRQLELLAGENLAGTELWIRVRDNGPGMDEETRRRVFSPFYTTKSTGTGLGLALTKKMVDAHGGAIEVESELGRGTEFALSLPRQLDAEGVER
jgi:signal transduction histidine kinase